MSAARTSTPTGTVNWASGESFDGYLLLGIVLPKDGGGIAWSKISLDNVLPAQRLPVWTPIPVREGAFLPTIGVFYNEDIEPPSTKYVAYYFDLALRQIAGPSATFTVTASTFTVPALTLTTPLEGTVTPTPDS